MGTEKGVKFDDNKPRLDLVLGNFANALWGVGLVGTYGARKYTDNGWQEVNNPIERYSNALLRHYINFRSGEELDAESGLPHLAHLAWNALAILELYVRMKKARDKAKCTCDDIKSFVNTFEEEVKEDKLSDDEIANILEQILDL